MVIAGSAALADPAGPTTASARAPTAIALAKLVIHPSRRSRAYPTRGLPGQRAALEFLTTTRAAVKPVVRPRAPHSAAQRRVRRIDRLVNRARQQEVDFCAGD